MKIEFDCDGIANCPMNEIATVEECLDCIYHKENEAGDICIYEYVFPEPEEEYATQIL